MEHEVRTAPYYAPGRRLRLVATDRRGQVVAHADMSSNRHRALVAYHLHQLLDLLEPDPDPPLTLLS